MRYTVVAIALLALAGCDFIGGAETLVRGSNNFISSDGNPDAVGKALSDFESIPAVTDDDLLTIYGRIRARALEGDLDASLVVLRLASIQRHPADEED